MPAVHIGSKDGSTLIPVNAKPDGTVDPEVQYDDDNNITVILRYACHTDYAIGLLPAVGAACPVSDYSSLIRKAVTIRPGTHINWVQIEVQYGAYLNTWRKKSGDTVKEASASFRELAVTDKRLGLTAAKQKALLAKGQKTVGIVNPRYSYTYYTNSFTWDEASVISGVGATGSPTGLSSATGDNWLKVERAIRQAADSLAEVRDSYDYNQNGWVVTEA